MSDFILGLDLGQAKDPSALCCLEKTGSAEATYTTRHLERFELGTSYPVICQRVCDIVAGKKDLHGSLLAVDQTGVGRAVVDILRLLPLQCGLVPITITGGHAASESDDGWHVPKKDLVAVLQILFSGRRLKVPRQLREAEMFVKELGNFKVKITTSANEVFGSWREGEHDDIVLAVACAAWTGENLCYPTEGAFGGGGDRNRNLTARPPEGVFIGE